MKYRIFEFEKIIYRGNLAFDFFLFCLKQEKSLIKYIFLHVYYFILFHLNKLTKERYYELYFSFLKGKKNVDELLNHFWDTYYYKLNSNILLNRETDRDWIISVYPLILIHPILEKYGYRHVSATNYNFENGKLLDPLLIGGYREETIIEKLKKNKIEVFYGFRESDEKIFELAESAYICKNYKNIKPYTKKRLEAKKNKLFRNLIVIIFLILWILIINFYFSLKVLDISIFKGYWKQPFLLLLNGFPILICLLFLYACTNRLWVSFGITNFLVFILGFVNKTKLIYRDDPFVFSDLNLVSESLEMTKRYELNINFVMILMILCSLFLIFLLILFYSEKKLSLKKRLILIGTLVVISFFGFRPIYHNEFIYDRVGDQSNINIWSATQQYQTRGFLYPFLYSSKVSTIQKPENYDETEVETILSNYELEDIPIYDGDKRVSVISIMLEAYQDFSIFESVHLNEDIYAPFHEIEAKSYSGRIVSNVFGGGTINTERSYLTGFYNMPSFRSSTNSFVRYFSNQAYYAEAMHPIYGWFYNRRNVDEILGFHNFDYYENRFSNIQSSFLSDMDFFDYIIEGYENSIAVNQPYFHFSVTYQNHGPYSTEKLYEEEYLTRTKSMDDETYHMINNYLSGIKETNLALKKLIDYFEEVNEPVVVLVFADHNPYLGENNIGYTQMGIDMDIGTEEGFLNYYGVPYFIWANDSTKSLTGNCFVGDAPTISPLFLMPELFQSLGWKGNQYLQYLTDIKERIQVIHNPWYYNGNIFTKELTEEEKKILDEFYNVEYYWLKHYQG